MGGARHSTQVWCGVVHGGERWWRHGHGSLAVLMYHQPSAAPRRPCVHNCRARSGGRNGGARPANPRKAGPATARKEVDVKWSDGPPHISAMARLLTVGVVQAQAEPSPRPEPLPSRPQLGAGGGEEGEHPVEEVLEEGRPHDELVGAVHDDTLAGALVEAG